MLLPRILDLKLAGMLDQYASNTRTNWSHCMKSTESSSDLHSSIKMLHMENKCYLPIHKSTSQLYNKFRDGTGMPVTAIVQPAKNIDAGSNAYEERCIEMEALIDRTNIKQVQCTRVDEMVRRNCKRISEQHNTKKNIVRQQVNELEWIRKNIEATAHSVMAK